MGDNENRKVYKARQVKNYREMVEYSCKNYAQNIAYKYKKDYTAKNVEYIEKTYEQVGKDIKAFGTGLLNLDLMGERIVVVGKNRYEWCISYLATTCSNMVIVPIDKALPDIEMQRLIERSEAKAINFGIVYGISDFGLANQLGVSNKQAKEYITQYLEKYSGIKHFMDDIVESAKNKGYVETLFHRRRYVPELKSNNYMVRQFGSRVAMNTPIQGTAADIMKLAMKNVYKELKKSKLDAKLILQIHDELLIEVKMEDREKAKDILKKSMVEAAKLSIPLEVEVSEGTNWYEVK